MRICSFFFFQTAAHVSRFRSTLILYTLSSAFHVIGETVSITKTVAEFLYEGYNDPLLTIAARVPHLAQTRFAGEKFAWFYKNKRFFFHLTASRPISGAQPASCPSGTGGQHLVLRLRFNGSVSALPLTSSYRSA
jgi:hypothetical protein